ncbi:MAG: (2Fe-2S) ferredoxin domain-containing protein [Burkholderiales bacterium]|nr:(2Fe-2S) ferredoxin domain-containing protein [Burkholderiales bacterium]
MPRPARHVFVCTQQRPPQHPRGSCSAHGSPAVLQAFWGELQRRQAQDGVAVTSCGCLGPCGDGANVLVYPEGVLYSGVQPADVAEIFDAHLAGGRPVERLLAHASVW